MSTAIDPRAIISSNAQIGEDVIVGPNTIVEDNVVIGHGTQIGANVLIASGTHIGHDCKIHHGAVLGSIPQDLKFHGEETTLEIGDFTTIREYATLNRGTSEQGKTTIGHHCFIMAYAHVAHDCSVGSHVILANSVNMAGHVIIEDFVVVGGMVPIHQFVRIGCHAMIGGGYRVPKDVPPYILAAQEPIAYQGLNTVGLRRRNFAPDVIATIEKAYFYIYQQNLNVSQALEKVRQEVEMTGEVKHIVDFIQRSKRGILGTHK
jgi:UDP-N-acetylglucosamine acyltransferase